MPKVAIVHDWLTGMRGGEYVLEAILELFPSAPIYTLICDRSKISDNILAHPICVSTLQKIPGIFRHYRNFLPLFPSAIGQFQLSEYDLVISSSHCVAKGVKKRNGARHISYIHAPMRYIWDRFDDYFGERASLPVRLAGKVMRSPLQKWDRDTSQSDQVDQLIANSKYIASQIKEHYGREAQVIHPFTDCRRFGRARTVKPDAPYLVVSAFAPNKRIELAIEACLSLGRKLDVIGGGQDEQKLRGYGSVESRGIRFLGQRSNEEIARAYSEARAFLFPGLEDFGITPLEAMAAGCPVIAFRGGGVVESLTQETAVFFDAPTSESLATAIKRFESESGKFSEMASRARASEFSKEVFQEKFRKVLHSQGVDL